MPTVIHKAVLEPLEIQHIEIPVNAVFLCAREQRDRVCVWYVCDPTGDKSRRKILCLGTGQEVPADLSHLVSHYLGIASFHDGSLIVHVFGE